MVTILIQMSQLAESDMVNLKHVLFETANSFIHFAWSQYDSTLVGDGIFGITEGKIMKDWGRVSGLGQSKA